MKVLTCLWIISMGFVMLVSACSGELVSVTETSPGSDPLDEPVEITPTVDTCVPLDTPGIAFPRQEPVEGPRETMAAELIGDLVLADGCLLIESLYGDESYLPLWPPEFTVRMEDQAPLILDGQGIIVGRVGEEIYMGGGEASRNALPVCIQEQMPKDCGGKVWVVGDGVRLNLKVDSDLFTMDRVPAPDRTAILLKKEPVLDDWAGDPETITGVLRYYYPDRCPRIKSESNARDFLPIWPPGYAIQILDDQVEILDGNDMVVARQDETVTLDGALVPSNWDNPDYRQLHYETPGDCFGPYFIVTTADRMTDIQQLPTSTPWIDIEYPPDTRTGIPEIDLVIDAVLTQDIDSRVELVRFIQIPCSTADGFGGPPKCERDEVDGTLVEAFPVSYSEGVHVRPAGIQSVLDFTVRGLLAVYDVPDGAYETDYWPAGEYAIVFTSEDGGHPHTVSLHVADGEIVLLKFSPDWPPFDQIWDRSDNFILPPSTRPNPNP